MKIPIFKARASRASDLLGVKGLGKTGETYIEDFLTEVFCGYPKEFSNKYTKKGLAQENVAIELVERVKDLGYIEKNTERRENDYLTGECDIVLKKSIDDIKCSWNAYTFPLFKKELDNYTYLVQGNCYLWLWDKEIFNVHYCLVDAPESLIDSEYWKAHRSAEIQSDEVDNILYEEVRAKMIHSHIPEEKRVKTFTFKRDEKVIDKLKERVLECRELINLKIGKN